MALPCGLVQRGVPALHVAVELRAAGAEQQLDRLELPVPRGVVQRGRAVAAERVDIVPAREQHGHLQTVTLTDQAVGWLMRLVG